MMLPVDITAIRGFFRRLLALNAHCIFKGRTTGRVGAVTLSCLSPVHHSTRQRSGSIMRSALLFFVISPVGGLCHDPMHSWRTPFNGVVVVENVLLLG